MEDVTVEWTNGLAIGLVVGMHRLEECSVHIVTSVNGPAGADGIPFLSLGIFPPFILDTDVLLSGFWVYDHHLTAQLSSSEVCSGHIADIYQTIRQWPAALHSCSGHIPTSYSGHERAIGRILGI